MAKQLSVKIVKGMYVPSRQAVSKMITSLSKEVKSNPAAAKAFVKDPSGFLSQKGFSVDLRREVLTEAGFKLSGAAGKCDYSCICTGCSVTRIGMADDIYANFPTLKTSLNKVLIASSRVGM